MSVRELLSTVAGESSAFARELRRVPLAEGALAPHDYVTALTFSYDDVSVRIWQVGGSRVRWWGAARSAHRGGILTRDGDGDRNGKEETWPVSPAVVRGLSRSAMRFAQLGSPAARSPAHVDLVYGPKLVVSGTPRSARGSVARLLFDDARNHATAARAVAALAVMATWFDDAWLGGPTCAACASHARPESTIALGPDDASDERQLQVVVCAACARRSLVLDEESRRGASERGRRREIDPGAARLSIVGAIRSCPARHDPRCPCAAHKDARVLVARGGA